MVRIVYPEQLLFRAESDHSSKLPRENDDLSDNV